MFCCPDPVVTLAAAITGLEYPTSGALK